MNDKPKSDAIQEDSVRLRRPMTTIVALLQDMEDVLEDEDLGSKKKLARVRKIKARISEIATIYLPE